MKLKKLLDRSPHRLAACVLALGMALSVGCSSPADRANQYYANGMALLEEGDLMRAQLELRNALQIVATMSDAIYGLALIAERQGNGEELVRLLQRVTELDPGHREAHLRMGQLLLGAGQLEEALKRARTALALAPGDPAALSLRAAVMYRLGDTEAAIADARAALEVAPGTVEALVVLASERMAAGDTAQAIAWLDEGLAADPSNISLHLIKLQALEASGDLDAAEALHKQLVDAHPERPALRQVLAQFYLRHQQPDAAEEQLRGIVAANPESLEAKLAVVRLVKSVRGGEAAVAELQAYVRQAPADTELRLALADLYRFRQDTPAMTALLREIVADANGRDALRAKSWLADVLLQTGEREEAEALVMAVLRHDGRHHEALLLKSRLAIEDRQLDDAIAELRRLLREVPDSAQGHQLLGRAHELAGAFELAEGQYLRGFQAGRQHERYGIPYVEFLLRRGKAARAEQVIQETLRASGGTLRLWQLLAHARISQGNWVGAQEAADVIARRGDGAVYAEQIRGVALAGMHNTEASIQAFRRAHAAAPDEPEPLMALVRAYVNDGRSDEAMRFLDGVLQTRPENATAHLLRGQLRLAAGDVEGAERALSAAIKAAPDRNEGYRNLAALHVREQRYADATRLLERGLERLPDDFVLRLSLAGVYEFAGQNDAAIALYERLLEQHPNADVVANNLASLLLERTDDNESLRRAYSLAQRFRRSDVPHFVDTLAWANYRMHRYQEAADLLERVTRQMPNAPIFRYHLGMVHRALGNEARAKAELKQALELSETVRFPQREAARAVLEAM